MVATTSMAVALVGIATPASAASPYDAQTATSMRNLAVAMESYAMFDGNDLYTGVTTSDLTGWGWTRPSSLAVTITIEGNGGSWRAIGQDVHTGTTEYAYASAKAFNGVSPGSVQPSSPQPLVPPTTAGLTLKDVGQAVDVDAMAARLVAAGTTVTEICDFSVFVKGTNFMGWSTSDQTNACYAAAAVPGATVRSVLARMLAIAGGTAVVTAVALEFIGDGTTTAAPPTWDPPTAPPNRQPPRTLPEDVWRLAKAAAAFAVANSVSSEMAKMAMQECLKNATNALGAVDPYEECSTKPIFMSGQADVDVATNHDIEALAQHPEWYALNRKYPRNDSDWKDKDPICKQKGDNENCDEYPFASTQQGGEFAVPPVHLKVIDGPKNQQQGSWLGAFYTACQVNDGDDFLAIPIPPTLPTVPTQRFCNF